jgi:hypothetical protein
MSSVPAFKARNPEISWSLWVKAAGGITLESCHYDCYSFIYVPQPFVC